MKKSNIILLIKIKAAVIVAMLSSAVIAGCSFTNHAERKYLARIEENQTSFRIPPSQFDTSWSRAKQFISTYSTRKIDVMNDSVISSEPTARFDLIFDGGYGYKVTANRIDDSVSILMRASSSSSFLTGSQALHNLYILIDYIKTGSLPFPELVSK